MVFFQFVRYFLWFERVMALFRIGAFNTLDGLLVIVNDRVGGFFAHSVFEKTDSFQLGIHHFDI